MMKIDYLDETPHPMDKRGKKTMNFSGSFIAILVLVSLIMGATGGVGTLLILSKSQALKNKLGINLQDLNISQNVTKKVILEESSAVIDAVKKVSPAVVSISTSRSVESFFGDLVQEDGGGTGFIITNDGLIVTNKHVAEAGDSLKVALTDGRTFDAEKVAVDPTNDLAILKINATGLPVVDLGDSDALQIGQWVIATGNALGELQNTVTVGVISARERQLTAGGNGTQEQLNNLLQTDAAINPGNSGGPLVNMDGQVVGINTAVAGNAQNIGFAIPINQAKSAIDSYKKTGKIIKPALGVRYRIINSEIAKSLNLTVDFGAMIIAPKGTDAVVKDGSADKAGLKSGDIILSLNGDRVDETHSLSGIIAKYLPNDEVEIKYLRDKKESTVKVKLGSTE